MKHNKHENGVLKRAWLLCLCVSFTISNSICYVADDDDASSRKKSADTTKSAKTLQERAAARHSAKLEKAGR